MLRGLLDYSSDFILEKAPLNIKNIILDSLKDIFLVYHIKEKDISIHLDLQHKNKFIGDDKKIYRVISNIIDNAVYALQSKRNLYFKTYEFQGSNFLKISNDGPPIPPSIIARIFDFNFSTKTNGSGLGLAISKRIINLHGGDIQCLSDSSSTSFIINFERSEQPEAIVNTILERKEEIWTYSPPLDKNMNNMNDRNENIFLKKEITILAIDDESFYLKDIAQTLVSINSIKNKYHYYPCESSHEAFTTLEKLKFWPDLIFCDLQLGPQSIDGLEIIKSLKSQECTSIIYAVSNDYTVQRHNDVLEAGASMFFHKPLSRPHIIGVLSTLTSTSSSLS
jgi:CheY-like chemotaxis protein